MVTNLIDVSFSPQIADQQRCVLGPLSLSIPAGELLSVVGASGCGKTTLLNIVAGLESGYQGTVERDRQHCHVSYMLQETSLLPWRSIRANIRLGLEIMRKPEPSPGIQEIITKIGLSEYSESFPNVLSGGMKRRAYLAQNLICSPDLLLLDEPFTGLDHQTKQAMRSLLIDRRNNKTILMATHDIEDAILMSDRIVVLTGSPTTINCVINVSSVNEKNMEYLEVERKIFDIFDTPALL